MKRLLLFLLALPLLATQAFALGHLVQINSCLTTASPAICQFASNTTNGNVLVAVLARYNFTGTPTVSFGNLTDSPQNNTYHAASGSCNFAWGAFSNQWGMCPAYAYNITGGTRPTLSWAMGGGVSTPNTLIIAELSGFSSSDPIDGTSSTTGATGGTVSISCAAGTISATVAMNAASGQTAGIFLVGLKLSASSDYTFLIAYQQSVSAAPTISPTASWANQITTADSSTNRMFYYDQFPGQVNPVASCASLGASTASAGACAFVE